MWNNKRSIRVRWVVTLGLFCLLVFLGGCQGGEISVTFGDDSGGTVGPDGTAGEPSGDTVVVGVQNGADKDVLGPLREAIAYWNEHDNRYDGAWEADFVVRPDAADPDLLAVFADEVDCANDYACATNVDSRARLLASDATVKVDVDELANTGELRYTLTHELGHVHGVDHCEAPRVYMGCPGSAENESRLYRTRENPWYPMQNLTVYVDTDDPVVRDDVRSVFAGFENSSETVPGRRFTFVEDPWHANVVMNVSSCGGCEYGDGERDLVVTGGRGYDDDGDSEFLRWARYRVVAPADEIRRGVENVLYDVLVSGRSWEW